MANPKQPGDQESAVTTDHGAAGRIEVDNHGNRVWRWARDVLDSTSILLKRLDNKDLALEPTQKVPVMQRGKPAAQKAVPEKKRVRLSMAPEAGSRGGVGSGFDPYNSGK